DERRAGRAADLILGRRTPEGRLPRSIVAGRAVGGGYLDDYVFMIQGLLDLFEASGDASRLRQALELQRQLDAHFWDAAAGGYFLTADDGERLLAREKPDYDGAEPAGNSVAVMNLLRLAELTGEQRYRARAGEAIDAFGPSLQRAPTSMPAMLAAVDFATDVPKEIAVVAPSEGAG